MAEAFASSFSSIYTTLELNKQFPHQVSNSSINNVEFTLADVKNKLSALDKNSSMVPDGLHPYLLKSCPSLAILLHMIFQQSVAQGKLPNDWKNSEIIPIFKKGSRHEPLNYRHIGLASVCCKILERILATAICEFLDSNHLLSDDQFGFRQKRSVEDQLFLGPYS